MSGEFFIARFDGHIAQEITAHEPPFPGLAKRILLPLYPFHYLAHILVSKQVLTLESNIYATVPIQLLSWLPTDRKRLRNASH